MGTRSLILINSEKLNKTVTLYKHWDGYPSDNLKMLFEAFKKEPKNLNQFMESLAKYYDRPLSEMIEFDSTFVKEPWDNIKDYSQHGDLEYFYIVNFDSKNIDVFGDGYNSESNHFKNGTIDPMSEIDCYYEDAQARYKDIITENLKNLKSIDVTINDKKNVKLEIVKSKIGMGITSSNNIDSDDFLLNGTPNAKTTTKKFQGVASQSIIDCYNDAGLVVTNVIKPNARNKENLKFNKHIIRLSTPENIEALKNGTKKSIVEIVVINNNNNRGSIVVMLGIYRLICSNGMIVGDNFYSEKVRHDGDTMANLLNALVMAKEKMGLVETVMQKMQAIELNKDQLIDYKKLIVKEFVETRLKTKTTKTINIKSYLNPIRQADLKNDLWTVFNRFQEHIIKGGINYSKIVTAKDVDGHEIDKLVNGTTRAIKGVDSLAKINSALFNATLNHFNIAA